MKKINKFILPKPIPPFKTLDEEAEFWDTHDLSDLGKKPLLELPLLEKEKEDMMTFRLQRYLKQKLELAARMKGLSPSSLVRMWVIEKLSI